jgi:hypothetical protein
MFWDPVVFESPDVPIGMKQLGVKRTSELRRDDDAEPAAAEAGK